MTWINLYFQALGNLLADPEFHAVYIDPASWAHYKKKGEFRDGVPRRNGIGQGTHLGGIEAGHQWRWIFHG